MSGNVFGTSKCLQQSFKDFKNLQTVQIVIRITLTTVTSVLSKHILHTLSNVSPPIGRPGDILEQKSQNSILKLHWHFGVGLYYSEIFAKGVIHTLSFVFFSDVLFWFGRLFSCLVSFASTQTRFFSITTSFAMKMMFFALPDRSD